VKEEFKTPWVENLRSGKYKQGQDYLKLKYDADDVRHCCIGVLAEQVGLPCVEEFDGTFTFYPKGADPKIVRANGMGSMEKKGALFEETLEEVGLSSQDQETLIGMNDNGMSFEAIADWIERHL
jgi:hypothetical protein